MEVTNALLQLRSMLEEIGGEAVGVRILVSSETMGALQTKLSGLMSSPDGIVFYALGFEFQKK